MIKKTEKQPVQRTTYSIRLNTELQKKIKEFAFVRGVKNYEIVERALENYLGGSKVVVNEVKKK